ncbi:MAG: N-methyl-L-tryptophan oxidase [Armatimonadota bacterium]
MNIAVIGLGGTGSAALRYLAEAGHTVTGYERYEIGHRRGSSHGNSRIIRYAYSDSLYTNLMTSAFPLWEQLCVKTGRDLMVKCGGVTFAPDGHPELEATLAALSGAGVVHDVLSAKDAMQRFPAFRFLDDEVVAFHADAGFLRSGEIVEAQIALAGDVGAEVRAGVEVVDVRESDTGVVVSTACGDTRRFDRVIVAGGAYLPMLFPEIGLPLTVTRQQVTYVGIEASATGVCHPERMPVWIDASTYWYGFPSDGRMDGVKVARHHPGDAVDPILDDRAVKGSDDDAAVRMAKKRIGGTLGNVIHSEVCLYTNTPNEDFIFDTAPTGKNVLLVSGCSGHGFKFTVLLGKAASYWATSGGFYHGLADERFRMPVSSR